MTWGAVAGAGVAAVGGMLSSSGGSTPKFRPMDVSSALGVADINKKKKQVNLNLSPEQQAIYDQLGGQIGSYLGGGGYGGNLSATIGSQVGGQIPGLFQGALDASALDPAFLQQYIAGMNPAAAQMSGLFGAAGQAGLNVLGGAQPGLNQSNYMFGLGQNLAANNYNDVFNQRLGLLREQALPFEQRAQDSFLNRMYSMGQLGTTGGNRNVEAFSRGLAQADTTRQLDAMSLSEALYGRDQNLAQGYMQGGLQGLLSGFGAQATAGQGLLGMAGNLGSQYGNFAGNILNAQQGYNDIVNTRAQQRLLNATELFGFGSNLNTQNLNTGIGLNNQQQSIIQQLLQQAQTGLQAGGAAAAAPMGQQSNPIGSLLQGFGGAMVQNPNMFSGMFSKQPNQPVVNSLGTAPVYTNDMSWFSQIAPTGQF